MLDRMSNSPYRQNSLCSDGLSTQLPCDTTAVDSGRGLRALWSRIECPREAQVSDIHGLLYACHRYGEHSGSTVWADIAK